jgi:hypothetical protein
MPPQCDGRDEQQEPDEGDHHEAGGATEVERHEEQREQ